MQVRVLFPAPFSSQASDQIQVLSNSSRLNDNLNFWHIIFRAIRRPVLLKLSDLAKWQWFSSNLGVDLTALDYFQLSLLGSFPLFHIHGYLTLNIIDFTLVSLLTF